jgi:hypothetical protein
VVVAEELGYRDVVVEPVSEHAAELVVLDDVVEVEYVVD